MSHTNGHLPDGAQLATLDMLRAANRKHVKATRLSAAVGSDVYVLVRAIRRTVYLQMLPPIPKGVVPETPDRGERAAAIHAWLDGLPAAERDERQRRFDEVTFKVLRAGMVEPAPTDDTLADLGDDADEIAAAILEFSGLTEKPEPVSA